MRKNIHLFIFALHFHLKIVGFCSYLVFLLYQCLRKYTAFVGCQFEKVVFYAI